MSEPCTACGKPNAPHQHYLQAPLGRCVVWSCDDVCAEAGREKRGGGKWFTDWPVRMPGDAPATHHREPDVNRYIPNRPSRKAYEGG